MVSALSRVMLPDLFTGRITSQPPLTVAVCTHASLFTHSMVSPTLALISAGENAIFLIVTVIVSAFTEIEPGKQNNRAIADRRRADVMTRPLTSVPSQHARHAVGVPEIS